MAVRLPDPSYLSKEFAKLSVGGACTTQPLLALAVQIKYNLEYQHDWTEVQICSKSPLDDSDLPRPVISGRPPRRVYIHPDELLEFIKADVKDEDIPTQNEWVLPSHLKERWSLSSFAHVFDKLSAVPPPSSAALPQDSRDTADEAKWRQTKRLLLATVDDDSTVVYYIMHDGIVKPRQN